MNAQMALQFEQACRYAAQQGINILEIAQRVSNQVNPIAAFNAQFPPAAAAPAAPAVAAQAEAQAPAAKPPMSPAKSFAKLKKALCNLKMHGIVNIGIINGARRTLREHPEVCEAAWKTVVDNLLAYKPAKGNRLTSEDAMKFVGAHKDEIPDNE